MTTPLIGLTSYAATEDGQFPLPREYVDSVRRGGGIPVLLPPGESLSERLLGRLDGLILTGGGDLDPVHYQGGCHETLYNVDAERDTLELSLVRLAVATELPLLGICRGTHLINVALGGTLHEHLPDVIGEAVTHRLPPREPTEHAVSVRAESRLGSLLGELEFVCASWHHQAIQDVADRLETAAFARDGTIEAVEMPGHRWLVGVQWHPELTAADDPIQQRLFDAFVAEAAG